MFWRFIGKNRAARIITLFCWVLDISESPFSINAEDNFTVDDLKTAIKAKKPNLLADFDADELNLWHVGDFLSPIY